jgi:hypothetical protein
MLYFIMLGVLYAECRLLKLLFLVLLCRMSLCRVLPFVNYLAECRYAECRGAKIYAYPIFNFFRVRKEASVSALMLGES